MKISVIMGTHNGDEFLSTAIKSIQEQTVSDWQLIICDDNSTDQTQALLTVFASNDSRIKILKNQQQQGLSYSLNRCLAHSQGEYIARMDDDDSCHPQRLAEQLAAFEQQPNIALVGCNAILFSGENNVHGKRNLPEQPSARQVFHGQNFVHPSVMIKRSALLSVGGYTISPLVLRAEDLDLWCKLYAHGFTGINLPQHLFYYREESHNMRQRNAQQYRTVAHVLNNWFPYLGLTLKDRYYMLVPLLKAITPKFIIQKLHYRRHYE